MNRAQREGKEGFNFKERGRLDEEEGEEKEEKKCLILDEREG